MKIKTQLIITMLLFSIILVVITVSAIIVNERTYEANKQEKIASSIAEGANELGYLADDYLVYRESQQLKRWQSRFASFSDQVASLSLHKSEQEAIVHNIQANQRRLKEVFDSVASNVGRPSQDQSVALDPAFFQVSWSRMAVQTQGLISDASRLSQILRQRTDQLREKRTILIYLIVILVGLFILVSYMSTYHRILKSIAALQAGTAVIGSGNLDFKIEEKKNDEIGDLSHAFNRMTASLKEVTASKEDLEREIVQRKKAETELQESRKFLEIANRHSDLNPLLQEFVTEMKEFTNCEAVGIRLLHENGDIPYKAYLGFSQQFYETESPLSIKTDKCMCINVVKGTTDPRLPFYTEGGSFYMNGTSRFLATVSGEDKGETRNVCNQVGYESVALIPLHVGSRMVGLIHLADYKENMVPLNMVTLLEQAASALGAGIQRAVAEEELRRQREWLQVTLSSIGDAVIATDTKGQVTFLNPVAATLTGWQSEEAQNQPIHSVFRIMNEKTRQRPEDLVVRVLNEKRVIGLANDTALITKDGREIPIEDSAAPILDSTGNIIGAVLVFHDVTEKRRTQEALRQAHDRAAWLARFPEQNPNPVMRASAEGTVLYCNPASANFPGWRCEVGRVLQNELLPLVARAMREGKEVQKDVDMAGRVYIVWITPFPGEGYANVYGRDITERKQAEEALREAQKQVEANLDAMTRLQKLGTLFVREGNVEGVFAEIVDAAIAISGADFGNIQILDPKSSDLKIMAHCGFPEWWLDFWNSVSKGKGACGTALERGERVIVEDVEQSPIFVGTPALEIQLKAGVRAVQSTPLVSRSGRRLGMFSTHYRRPHRPEDSVLRLLDLLARQTADIIERAQAEETLRKSEERLKAIATSTPDHLLVQDRELRYELVINPQLGLTEQDMIGKTDHDILTKEDADKLTRTKRQVLESGNSVHLEMPLTSKKGEQEFFDGSYIAKFDEKGQTDGLIGYFKNITERKRMEEEVRQSEEKSRLLIKYAPSMFYEIDFRGLAFKSVNDTMCEFLGYTREELLAMNPFDLLDDEGKALFRERIRRKFAGEDISDSVEYKSKTKDGKEVYGILNISFTYKDGKPEGAVVVAHDITQRKQAEEALKQRSLELHNLAVTLEQRIRERTAELEEANRTLRQLSIRLLSAQEEERKRVAGEIHDSMGSCLSGIKFKVESAIEEIAKTPKVAAQSLNDIVPVIQEAVEECRRIQMDLRPSMLDDLGLLPTLSWFCRRYQTIYSGIRVEQETVLEESDVPNLLKTVIYRVTQEAMNNIAKHSQASLVHLCLRKIDDRMELSVKDNGRGFSVQHRLFLDDSRRGLGLTSMKERTELSGGSFAIESAEGKGTMIRASWNI